MNIDRPQKITDILILNKITDNCRFLFVKQKDCYCIENFHFRTRVRIETKNIN